jgi:hypothetical protein
MKPDVILTDMNLPGLSGKVLARDYNFGLDSGGKDSC